jgi:hypothetical protein
MLKALYFAVLAIRQESPPPSGGKCFVRRYVPAFICGVRGVGEDHDVTVRVGDRGELRAGECG